MFRFKRLFGERLWARSLATQRVEAVVTCTVLNRMTHLGCLKRCAWRDESPRKGELPVTLRIVQQRQ